MSFIALRLFIFFLSLLLLLLYFIALCHLALYCQFNCFIHWNTTSLFILLEADASFVHLSPHRSGTLGLLWSFCLGCLVISWIVLSLGDRRCHRWWHWNDRLHDEHERHTEHGCTMQVYVQGGVVKIPLRAYFPDLAISKKEFSTTRLQQALFSAGTASSWQL